MKKVCLFMLVLALVGSMVFAQISISGSLRAHAGYSTEGTPAGSGYYTDLGKELTFKNDASRIVFKGDLAGKAGVNAELRLATPTITSVSTSANVPDIPGQEITTTTTSTSSDVFFQLRNFYVWAKPAEFVRFTLGWMENTDYRISDSSATTAFGGSIRNTNSAEPIAYRYFGALAQFYLLSNNLNIGVAVSGDSMGNVTKTDNMLAYLAVMYTFPNLGKLVVEGQMATTLTDTVDKVRFSGTFQLAPSKAWNAALGFKFAGKNAIKSDSGGYRSLSGKNGDWSGNAPDSRVSLMLLGAFKGIDKLSIDGGFEIFLTNGLALAESVSVSYNFGFLKPVLYTFGMTTFDKVNRMPVQKAGSDSIDSRVIGLALNLPVNVGVASFLEAGIAYDTGVAAFQVPVYFRLFF